MDMVKKFTLYLNLLVLPFALSLLPRTVLSQIDVSITTTDNTVCNGIACDYNGPSILINELMLSPSSNDGSMWGGNSNQAGEWIELYNPDVCNSVDISCYHLGNNTNDGGTYPGGYVIPAGTVVPPAGFAMIRGVNADPVPENLLVENGGNVVELVVDGTGVCVGGGNRLWFPNAGGWFAFYDNNGVPQDAVSWANQSNTDQYPCIPLPALPGCSYSGLLPNYDEFPADRKEYILPVSAATYQGQSLRRIPDGGAWDAQGTPTYATCNSTCIDPNFLICNGTATANPTGGLGPYTYLWDDVQDQTTQTATNLCAGSYCVTITDANGDTETQCIDVLDAEYNTTIADGFCPGETYTLPDNSTVSAPGTYNFTYQTLGDCDSTVTVNLVEYPVYSFDLNPQICQNQTYTLPDGTEVSTTGNYTVSYQTIHGCDSIYNVNLTVSSPIQIPIDVEMCSGDWYQLPDGNIVTAEGTFDVLISGGPSCDTLYSVNVAFYDDIDISFSEYENISCFGEGDGSVELNVSGGSPPYTFTWSDGIDHGTVASDLDSGTYTIEITDANGCQADTTFEIIEPDLVSITASANTTICLGTDADLIAEATGGTGDFTYYWSGSTSNDGNLTVSPDSDATYLVYAADENGCTTDSVSIAIDVITMHPDSLETTAAISACQGTEISLGARYHGEYPPYQFIWNNGLPNTAGPHSVSPNTSTVYTVVVTDNCGNEVTADIPVTVWENPEATVESISDVTCFGLNDGSAGINATNGTPVYSYTWSDGQDHGNNPEGLAPGDYAVVVEDANGCSSQAEFTIAEPEEIMISAISDTLICYGSELDLFANAEGGTGALTYNWSHTSDQGSNQMVLAENDTIFTVFAEDENGCASSTAEIGVEVINMFPDQLVISNDTAVCPGEPVDIMATYSGAYPPYVYQWSSLDIEETGPTTITPENSVTYLLTVQDECGNAITDSVQIDVFELPEVILPDVLISGCSPLEAILMDTINVSTDYSYTWNFTNGETYFGNPANFTITEPGVYEVYLEITTDDGCTATSSNSIPVEVYELPIASFLASPWTADIEDPNINFTDQGEGSTLNIWTINGETFENENLISYTFPDTGIYPIELFVENEFGCADSITQWIEIEVEYDITIPNAFTPGDGGDNPYYDPTSLTNTVFYPFSEYVEEIRMSIFNRWGEMIFETTELGKGWNGTYRDKPCPMDVYVYRIDFVFADGNEVTKVGDITLLR